MNRFRYLCASAVLSLLLSACSSPPPGQPQKDAETVAPNQVLEFTTLYAQNCAGCHGAQGRGGAAIALADPVYLAIVDEASMRKVIANGVRGTSMPAFAQSAGGMLTDKQIDVITSGIFSRWGRTGNSRRKQSTFLCGKNCGQCRAMANSFTEHIAHPATAQEARAGPRAAPSPTIHFWLWSATRDCARSSSPAGRNWARPTGAATFQESR